MVLAFLMMWSPVADRLGSDDYRDREAWYRLYDNPWAARLLPAAHDDPEVDRRCKAIRVKWLKWDNPLYIERLVLSSDFDRWLRNYLACGRSAIAYEYDTFTIFFGNDRNRGKLLALLPVQPGETDSFLCFPAMPSDFPRWKSYIDHHKR